jgi:hypothetical protein
LHGFLKIKRNGSRFIAAVFVCIMLFGGCASKFQMDQEDLRSGRPARLLHKSFVGDDINETSSLHGGSYQGSHRLPFSFKVCSHRLQTAKVRWSKKKGAACQELLFLF